MMNSSKKYKFVFLGNFAINTILSIILLTILWLNLDNTTFKSSLESLICFWGITMILSLWNRAFIATYKYDGNKILNAGVTQLFSFSLFFIECMILYTSLFDHINFLTPTTICMSIWSVIFLGAIFIGKNFVQPTS